MNIIYISPKGGETPDLFNTFSKVFSANGHISTTNPNYADVCFFDFHSRIFPYDIETLGIVIKRNLPIVTFDAWDYGAMAKYEYPGELPQQIKDFLNSPNKKIHFVRKMDKTKEYDKNVYPYELIMYSDHIFEPVTQNQLFDRAIDVCFIGNTSPERENIIEGLKKNNINGYYRFTIEKKFEHDNWLHHHKQCKMFIEASGGGFGSERPYQLMYIAPMLKVKNNQLILHNFRDGLECIEISEEPTIQEIKTLNDVLSDKYLLYEIYCNGIARVKKYFCADYRANYILVTLKKEGIC